MNDKQSQTGKITLVKGDEINDDKEVANIINIFFAKLIKNLSMKINDDHSSGTKNLTDNIDIAIKSYENHPNIIAISRSVTRKVNFSFNHVTYDKIEKLRNC